jgi:hypothetical protein
VHDILNTIFHFNEMINESGMIEPKESNERAIKYPGQANEGE